MNFDFLKKYDWKEISDEWYGSSKDTPIEPIQKIPENYELHYKGKNFPVEVNGEFYENTKQAAQELGINYHTLRGWISGKRTSKIQCKKLPS